MLCYCACVRTTTWNREKFGETLELLSKRAQLSQGQIAELAGRSRSQINRWTRSENQPNYEAVARLAGTIARQHPDLAELTQQLMRAAGYGEDAVEGGDDKPPAHAPPPKQATTPVLHGKTLGDVLVERGLRQPDELGISDQVVDDPVVQELLDSDFDEDFKNRYLLLYSTMRREIFEQVRKKNEKPQGQ